MAEITEPADDGWGRHASSKIADDAASGGYGRTAWPALGRARMGIPSPTRLDALMREKKLSSYAGWALRKAGVRDLVELRSWSAEQLGSVQRLGSKGLREIERLLNVYGLRTSV